MARGVVMDWLRDDAQVRTLVRWLYYQNLILTVEEVFDAWATPWDWASEREHMLGNHKDREDPELSDDCAACREGVPPQEGSS